MSETNGTTTTNRVKGVSAGVKRTALPKTRSASRKAMRGAKRMAAAVGGIGAGVLALSVTHCTEAIGLLTGSDMLLSGLLAVGIDAGMVVSEMAEVAVHGTKAEAEVKPWARGYTIAAVLLSILLNAYSFGLHADTGMVWAAWLLGACIPCGVYALGRQAAKLWTRSE